MPEGVNAQFYQIRADYSGEACDFALDSIIDHQGERPVREAPSNFAGAIKPC
jgi:hypothetical protein